MIRKLLAGVAAVALASSAYAAQIAVTPTYVTSYDITDPSNPVPVGTMDLASAASRQAKYLHVFEVDAATTLATNQGFDYVSFNVAKTGNMTTVSGYPYDSANQPNAALFNNDADLGSDSADLQSIFVSATKQQSYNNLRGNQGTIVLGEFYLSFAGNSTAAAQVSITPINGFTWGYYDAMSKSGLSTYNGTPTDMNTAFTGNVINIPAVPEPASLSLLGLGVLGLAARRRQA